MVRNAARHRPVLALLAVSIGGGCLSLRAAAENPRSDELETVYWDGPMENGQLTGGRVLLPKPDLSNIRGVDGGYETIINNGPPSNRIDIVTVGDGYLSNQLGTYNTNVVNAINDLFDIEPFTTYAPFFNVHRVDVVSPQAGVDHDPTYPIWRNTALDMGFFCGGTERLLCVNVSKAYSHAISAPDVDQVLAVANSSKYGGAGYTSSDLATFSGSNGSSTQVAIHELGHSFGNLADEYDYGGPDTYTGPERPEPNVSILNSTQMQQQGTKWAAWLGYNNAQYDGLISTYEGAHYSRRGIYRPSNNSMMRSLNRPFNLPSVESLVIEFYKIVNPIDDSTPENELLNASSVVWVDVVETIGAPLDIQWYLDNQPIAGANDETLDLSTVNMSDGMHQLKVVVVDNTWFVRNEAARAQWMTGSRQWTVDVENGVADFLGFTVQTGTHQSGNAAELIESDDAYLGVRSGRGGTAVEPFITDVQYNFESGVTNASNISIVVESRINQTSGIAQVSVKNMDTGDFDLVSTFAVGLDDVPMQIDGLSAQQYLNPNNGRIRLRVKHIVVGTFFSFSFDSYQDQVRVTVH